jgi:hypothetical protein
MPIGPKIASGKFIRPPRVLPGKLGRGPNRLTRLQRHLLTRVPTGLAVHEVYLVALRHYLLHLAGKCHARILLPLLLYLFPRLRALGHYILYLHRGHSAWLLAKTAWSECECQGECGSTYCSR